MEPFGPYALLAFGLATVLLLGLGTFLWIRDPAKAPPRRYRQRVACPRRGARAEVDILEERQSGFLTRRVTHCSLLKDGEHCAQECCWPA